MNRLKSNARIIAYVQLFHEHPQDLTWVGWENALRLYRVWEANEACEDERSRAEAKFTGIIRYGRVQYYTLILWLHIVMAISVAVLLGYRAWALSPAPECPVTKVSLVQLGLGINLVVVVVFLIWARRFSPEKLADAVEEDRIRWRAVFASHTDGKLAKTMGLDTLGKS